MEFRINGEGEAAEFDNKSFPISDDDKDLAEFERTQIGWPEDDVIGVQQPLFSDNELIGSKEEELLIEEVKEEEEHLPVNEQQINMFEDEVIDSSKVKTDPTPKDAESRFDDRVVQNALSNSPVEGGIVKNKTTGPTMTMRSDITPLNKDGETIKPQANMTADSLMGKYEVTGFSVDYHTGKTTASVQIRDYFSDLETAFASVNNSKYLMPMPGAGYKIATINSGAPRISFNEREIYLYKDNQWVRT